VRLSRGREGGSGGLTDEHLCQVRFVCGLFDQFLGLSTHRQGDGIILLTQPSRGEGLLAVLISQRDFISIWMLQIINPKREREREAETERERDRDRETETETERERAERDRG
jgi:hypothetical protein